MDTKKLRAAVEAAGHDPHFFTPSAMRFFGDSMSNYGVRASPVTVHGFRGPVLCWALYRRKPVKNGVKADTYFCCDTFRRVFGEAA